MSKETIIDDVSNLHNQHQIAHLSWGHAGTELAVIDVFGQISLYSIFMTINRIATMRKCTFDPEDNLSAVISMMWLYNDKGVDHNVPVYRKVSLTF